tara:strand:+ start:3213 stop:3938 length:726 start_codon:yes stop_codon:yes gene_type:complete
MKNLLFFMSMLFGLHGVPASPSLSKEPAAAIVESVNSSFSKVELKVRNAAVRVWSDGGHGSGSYLVHKGFHFVLTAQHVVDGPLGTNYVVGKDEETTLATLVYSDAADDIAVLYVPSGFKSIEPMKYKPMKKIANISERITYSGFPSSHKLMTIRGRVAGYEDKEGSGKQIMLHTYGWFGCSGSVIYNDSGEVVGVLWGVDAEYYPTIAIIEDMIWVVPIQELDIEKPIKLICRYNKMKFC